MIKSLEDVNPRNYDKGFIMEFIQKVSPFTETNQKLLYLIEQFFQNDMDVPITVSMNETEIDPETKENRIKFFMLWLNGTTLYTGTHFVKEKDLTNGMILNDYEPE